MILYSALSAVGFRPALRRVLRMDVRAAGHVPASGPAILAANHESIWDPWILGVVTERPIRYLAKAELWENRALAAVMDGFGAFPVERGGGDVLAMRRGVELLEAGEVLGVFPQGTTKVDRPRRFGRGAARLALQTGAPIVPVRMQGTRDLLRPGFPQVTLVVLPPLVVEPVRATVAAAREITDRLEALLAA